VVRFASAFSQLPLTKPVAKLLRQFPFIDQQFERLETLQNGIQIMQGRPNEVAKKLSYWRNKAVNFEQSLNKNPAEDGCGLLWYAPLIPMNKTEIKGFVEHVRNTCKRHNIDPMITFTNLSHDLIDSTIPILFDAHSADAVNQAQSCLNELVSEGLKLGYVPYRLNIEQQKQFMNSDLSVFRIMQSIYEKVDTKGVLQRGRYGK
jgi:4-cresol dehydrogenase (hydroxylating)